MATTQDTIAAQLAQGQKISISGSKATGVITSVKIRVTLDNGLVLTLDRDKIVQVEQERYDVCPNGQAAPECTEIDPCEMCWQDENC